jgi:hypothetical protein
VNTSSPGKHPELIFEPIIVFLGDFQDFIGSHHEFPTTVAQFFAFAASSDGVVV